MKGLDHVLKGRRIGSDTVCICLVILLLGAAFAKVSAVGIILCLYKGTQRMKIPSNIIAAVGAIGLILGGAGVNIFLVVLGLAVVIVLEMPYEKSDADSALRHGVQAAVATLLVLLLKQAIFGLSISSLSGVFLQAVTVFAGVQIFRRAGDYITNHNKKKMSGESSVFIGIILAAAIQGLFHFQFIGIDFQTIMGIALIQYFAWRYGSGVAAVTGGAFGLFMALLGPNAFAASECVALYTIAGFISGIFYRFGTMTGILGFLLGVIFSKMVFSQWDTGIMPIMSLFTATVILLSIGRVKKLSEKFHLEKFFVKDGATDKDIALTEKQPISVLERIKGISSSIQAFVSSFNQSAAHLHEDMQEDMCGMFSKIAGETCVDCSLAGYCWDRGFYDTCSALSMMTESLQNKKKLSAQDLPTFFAKKCERKSQIASATTTAYEVFRTEMLWKQRLKENKALMTKQFENLIQLLSNMTDELVNEREKLSKSERWLEEIIEREYGDVSVFIRQDKKGRYDMEVTVEDYDCFPWDENEMANTISKEVNKNMVFDCIKKTGVKNVIAKYVEEDAFKVVVGVAQQSKIENDDCGDSFTFDKFGTGVYLAGISDGMGTGENASKFSEATMTLLEGLISGGIEMKQAVEFINTNIMLQENGETIVTLDLALIDLYDGETQFLKIGAAPTVLKLQEKVDLINTKSMPIGMNSDVDLQPEMRTLKDGEVMVFMSDGVFDIFMEESNMEDMKSVIEDSDKVNPQEVANELIEVARKKGAGKNKDDMSVMVLKLYKKAA